MGIGGAGVEQAGGANTQQPDVVMLLIGIYGGTGLFLEEYRWGLVLAVCLCLY